MDTHDLLARLLALEAREVRRTAQDERLWTVLERLARRIDAVEAKAELLSRPGRTCLPTDTEDDRMLDLLIAAVGA